MKLNFRSPTVDQLDFLSTVLGAIGGIAELLIACKRISNEDGQLIAGLAIIAWGFFSNKPPRIAKFRQYHQAQPHPELLLDELRE